MADSFGSRVFKVVGSNRSISQSIRQRKYTYGYQIKFKNESTVILNRGKQRIFRGMKRTIEKL
mgnify:CR=1 FL=1